MGLPQRFKQQIYIPFGNLVIQLQRFDFRLGSTFLIFILPFQLFQLHPFHRVIQFSLPHLFPGTGPDAIQIPFVIQRHQRPFQRHFVNINLHFHLRQIAGYRPTLQIQFTQLHFQRFLLGVVFRFNRFQIQLQ